MSYVWNFVTNFFQNCTMMPTNRKEPEEDVNIDFRKKSRKIHLTAPAVYTSSRNILSLRTEAAFGDPADLFQNEPVISSEDTIEAHIDVRREFLLGDYKMHILQAKVKPAWNVAILCPEDISPAKIHNLLNMSNMGEIFRCSNYLSRYNWMHYRNWETANENFRKNGRRFMTVVRNYLGVYPPLIDDEEDEATAEGWRMRNLLFFVDADHLPTLERGDMTFEKDNEWVHVIKTLGGKVFGYMIQVKEGSGLAGGDYWHYGCVLVDRDSLKCFAFVFGDFYTCQNDTSLEKPPVNVCAANYIFEKARFLKE